MSTNEGQNQEQIMFVSLIPIITLVMFYLLNSLVMFYLLNLNSENVRVKC